MLMSGLSQCNGITSVYCWIKLVQVVLSGLLALFAISEIVLSLIKIHGRLIINFFISIELFFVISLLCNLFHETWHKVKALEFLGILFWNLAFITIFYYVGWNALEGRASRICLHIIYIGLTITYVALAIDRCVEEFEEKQKLPYHCTEKWYIVVNSIALVISVILFGIFWMKHRKERRIRESYERRLFNKTEDKIPEQKLMLSEIKVNNPFSRMWVLIMANIIGSIISLAETIILWAAYNKYCEFSQNPNVQSSIGFIFQLFSYYLIILISLIIFRVIRLSFIRSMEIDDQLVRERPNSYSDWNTFSANANKLELVLQDSISSRNSSL